MIDSHFVDFCQLFIYISGSQPEDWDPPRGRKTTVHNMINKRKIISLTKMFFFFSFYVFGILRKYPIVTLWLNSTHGSIQPVISRPE